MEEQIDAIHAHLYQWGKVRGLGALLHKLTIKQYTFADKT